MAPSQDCSAEEEEGYRRRRKRGKSRLLMSEIATVSGDGGDGGDGGCGEVLVEVLVEACYKVLVEVLKRRNGTRHMHRRSAASTTTLLRVTIVVSPQYDSAEWKPAFLRQAREFLFFPLLPREASK